MKKLTAGIFAGILTIVTVNAADAAIASKAYVDGQRDANKALIQENTTKITDLTTTVTNNKSATDEAIAGLKETVDGLVGEGTGSVAEQIAGALGELPEGSTVKTELDKKQDKSTEDYALGTAAGGWKALTDAEKNALQSGATSALVGKITTNETAIGGLTTRVSTAEGEIDTLQAATTGLTAEKVTQITTNQTAINDITKENGTIDTKIKAATDTINTALDGKQATLSATNVTTTGTGNAIVSITAADGVVTATKGAVVPEVTATGETGTFVLTATVTDSGVTNYMWESIERATSATPATPAE